jgi:multiple sugar transport system substrate-binding protein
MSKKLSRRAFLRGIGAAGAGLAATMAGCQPKTVIVKEVVKETVEVEKEVEKVVKETVVVEKQVGPVGLPDMTIRFGYGGWAQQYAEIMITNFQTRFPNVNVDIEIIAGDFIQKLYTMAAAGTTADAQWIADAHVIPLAVNGVMLDMNPLADADTEFDSSDIYPVMKGLGEYQGAWYMMPWAADAPVMYYNKTMLEEAGYPLPDPMNGYTVQEFQEACGAVYDPDKEQYGWLGGENWWAVYVPWIYGFGGRFYNEDKSGVLVDSPEAAEACQALADIYNVYNGAVPKGADFGGNALLLGKACFWLMNRFYCANLRDAEVEFEWDVAVPPRQPVKHTAGAGTMGPGVSAAAAQRGTEVAAWKLVSTIAMSGTQKHFARQYLSIPVLQSMAKDDSWYGLAAPPENRDVFLKVPEIAITPPTPLNNDCGTVYVGETNKAMNDAWDEMVVGGVPAEQALEKAAEIINDCMARGGA